MQADTAQLLRLDTCVLDGVSDAIVALDAAGRVLRANAAAAALVGQTEAALIGKMASNVFHWEDQTGRTLPRDESFGKRSRIRVDNCYFRKRAGDRVPVEITSTLISDHRAGIELIVQVIRDVTRAREGEALKNQGLSLLSHELRAPIGHIKGFASSLTDTEVTWDAATQRDFLIEIDREASRLSRLVDRLLDMSRLEAGLPLTEVAELSPAVLTSRAVREVRWATAEHHLVVDVPDDLPDVLGSGAHLERVLGNLLENAAKYSDSGSQIEIEARLVDAMVRWYVTDQGDGVPIDYRESIFGKFVRAPNIASRKPGLGLGLPICKGIVEAHRGKLWLESPAAGGSRFAFTIPLASTGVT